MRESTTSYAPHQRLRPYIARFFSSSVCLGGAKAINKPRIASSVVDVIFTVGSPPKKMFADGSAPSCPEAMIIGTSNIPNKFALFTDSSYLGISFWRGAAAAFFKLPLSLIHNREIPLADIWGHGASVLLDRLHNAPSDPERIRILQSACLNRLRNLNHVPNSVLEAQRMIERSDEKVPVKEVASSLNLSHQHLNWLMKRYVGMTALMYKRMMRYESAARFLSNGKSQNQSDLAYRFGFADQSHMIREFRIFTGLSPIAYASMAKKREIFIPGKKAFKIKLSPQTELPVPAPEILILFYMEYPYSNYHFG